MNAPVLNAIDCPCCGTKARVTAAGSGALTVYCPSCKFQGFAKSPKAVESLKARMGVKPAPPAGAGGAQDAPPAKSGDWLKEL